MIVFGIDPGKTVGVAQLSTADMVMHADQIGFDVLGEWLEAWLAALPDADVLVACERFSISAGTVRKGTQDAHWAIEIFGVVRFLCRKYHARFKPQNPGNAKNFAKDDRLRSCGWYVPGRDHATDAVRHVVLAMAEDGCIPPPWVVP